MNSPEVLPVLLIGGKPAEGVAAVQRLGLPYILVVDPEDGPARDDTAECVWPLPFKRQPLSIFTLIGRRSIAGVVSFTELGLLPAALLAVSMRVPGAPLGPVLRTRNKVQMRLALVGAVPQPDFGLVGDREPSRFPVVVKPVDGSGSRGVELISDASSFRRCRDHRMGDLWENFLAGREFSVETVTRHGEHRVIGVTEKLTTGAPYFVETGHLVPARVDEDTRIGLEATTLAVLHGLGVADSAAHTELKWLDGRAFLIETHTRCGGDRIPLLHRLVGGHDQHALGVPAALHPGLEPTEARFPCAGVRYFQWPPGVLTQVRGVEAARSLPGVVDLRISALPGERLGVWRYSHERPGHCVVGGASSYEVLARLDQVERLLEVRYLEPAEVARGRHRVSQGPPAPRIGQHEAVEYEGSTRAVL